MVLRCHVVDPMSVTFETLSGSCILKGYRHAIERRPVSKQAVLRTSPADVVGYLDGSSSQPPEFETRILECYMVMPYTHAVHPELDLVIPNDAAKIS